MVFWFKRHFTDCPFPPPISCSVSCSQHLIASCRISVSLSSQCFRIATTRQCQVSIPGQLESTTNVCSLVLLSVSPVHSNRWPPQMCAAILVLWRHIAAGACQPLSDGVKLQIWHFHYGGWTQLACMLHQWMIGSVCHRMHRFWGFSQSHLTAFFGNGNCFMIHFGSRPMKNKSCIIDCMLCLFDLGIYIGYIYSEMLYVEGYKRVDHWVWISLCVYLVLKYSRYMTW